MFYYLLDGVDYALITSIPNIIYDFITKNGKGSFKDFNNPQYFIDTLSKSIKIVSSLPAENREFRTVLVPPLIQKGDIKEIAALLPADASWQFAQFQNSNCLDPSYNEIYPYTDNEAKDLIEYAKSFIPGAALR